MFFKKNCIYFFMFLLNSLIQTTMCSISINEMQNQVKKGFPEWMINQISKDLSEFYSSGITKKMISETLLQDPVCLVRFTIKNGKISVKYNHQMNKHHQIEATKPLIEVLTELNAYLPLPDVEFIYCFDDAPFCWHFINIPFFKNHILYKAPVFAACKEKENSSAVLIPDFQTLSFIQNNMTNNIHCGNTKYPWLSKKNKAFWRGATTGGFYRIHNYENFPRIKLVKLSTEFPDLLDAKFNQIWKVDNGTHKKIIELNYIGNTISIDEHLKYKYQILIDGNAASWSRAYWQFHGNSVVLKQDSNYIVWHNELFKPWIHYIPFNHDCKDLIKKIQWAKENDEAAKKIAEAAYIQAHNNLRYIDILLYFYALITEYAKLQKEC